MQVLGYEDQMLGLHNKLYRERDLAEAQGLALIDAIKPSRPVEILTVNKVDLFLDTHPNILCYAHGASPLQFWYFPCSR